MPNKNAIVEAISLAAIIGGLVNELGWSKAGLIAGTISFLLVHIGPRKTDDEAE